MKLKARHKLIPAIAMMLVSVLCLSTASYAWFTMNTTVTANGIELTATGADNLLISLTGADDTWSDSVDLSLTHTGTLLPASTSNGLNFFAISSNLVAGTTQGVGGGPKAGVQAVAASTALGATGDGYWADFTVYIKTQDGTNMPITLGTGTKAVDVTAEATNKEIYKSVRLAVLKGDKSAGIASAFIFPMDATDGKAYFPNVTGPINAVSAAATDPDAYGNPVYDGDEWKGTELTTEYITAGTSQLFTASGTPTQVTLRLWIEGQNKFCGNYEKNADFNFVVVFTKIA